MAGSMHAMREKIWTMSGVATAVAMLFANAANAATPSWVAAFLHDREITRYRIAQADLDEDGHPEALIYGMDTAGGGAADLCGTGGCNLYVLSPAATGHRLVADITVTRPPVRLLPATTQGWHDLGVLVRGDGVASYEARLRFDGAGYPSNPTVPPATRLEGTPGEVVIEQPPLDTVRAVHQIIARLDLGSFANSTGPRREPGKKSFADYGFTVVELTRDGAILYRPDHGWAMQFRILGQDSSSIRICLQDRGLLQPGDIRAPSYNARSALVLSSSGEKWWKAEQLPTGFETCTNDPPMTDPDDSIGLPSGSPTVAVEYAGDSEYRACSSGTTNTLALAECGRRYIAAAKAELAVTLAQAKEGKSETVRRHLDREQAAFAQYLDTACGYLARRIEFGSDGVAVHEPLCRVHLVQDRTDHLRRLFDWTGERARPHASGHGTN